MAQSLPLMLSNPSGIERAQIPVIGSIKVRAHDTEKGRRLDRWQAGSERHCLMTDTVLPLTSVFSHTCPSGAQLSDLVIQSLSD